MRKFISRVHVGLSWLVLAAAGVQFILAGLGVFGATNFSAHVLVGTAITISSLVLVALSLLGRLGRARIGFSLLLAVFMFIQSFLAHSQPWIAALHPALGVFILFTALRLFRLGTQSMIRRKGEAVQ